jgi:flagellar hook assembly protein FlgD
VSITIYDLMGREVRSLVNKQVNAGNHSTLWNATNAMGAPVSAGVYIYTITANEYRDVKKMILLK